MDYSDKLNEAEQLMISGHFAQAVTSSGQLCEEMLRELYRQVLPRLVPADQRELAEKIEKIGGDKSAEKLTLGQIVGVFRESRLFEKCEKSLSLDLTKLKRADLTTFVDLRNQAAHGASIEGDEARMLVSQVRVWLRAAGLLEEPAKTTTQRATGGHLPPWTQKVRLNADVEAGNTAVATYAIDLGGVIAGDRAVPSLYREADSFFGATYATGGMRRLMSEVLGRLAGQGGDRVLQLRSPFGGGKSHLLLSLYHAVNDHKALLANWPEAARLPDPGSVRVGWFDGEKFDVQGRMVAPGVTVRTMWGWLAWRLGGEPLYREFAYHDERKIAPGGDKIRLLIEGDQPVLLLLDEVLKYFERAQADTTAVGDSTLGRQTMDFIQSLSTEVANSPRAVMIYSLQASVRESFGNVALLSMLDHLTARVDAKREPIQGDEILPVLQRRLLAGKIDQRASEAVAEGYTQEITNMRAAHAADESARRAADDDSRALRARFKAAYPFHPTLIDLMSQRWASLPDFQRTRGALRFLATCLHVLKRENEAGTVLGPGDIPIRDADVQNAFFTEVGQGDAFKAVLLHDFTGPTARARRIDERLAREHPHLSGVHPAMRLATAILMYSFGGLNRPGENTGEIIGTGVTEPELLAAVIGPDLDSITAETALKQLRDQCLYLHFDGVRYVFKTTPNVTKLLEDEAEFSVKEEEVRKTIKDDLENRLAGRAAIIWPEHSAKIPDREPRFLMTYLPLEFVQQSDSAQKAIATEYLMRCGDGPRHYRNGLALAIPDGRQIESLRRAARYLKAVELLRNKRRQLNLTTEQMDQLKEREGTEKSVLESSMRGLYTTVYLPQVSGGAVTLEQLDTGGRPLSATGIHERLMELLTVVVRRVHPLLTPAKFMELLQLGEQINQDEMASLGTSAERIRDMFFEVPGFPRLLDETALKRVIIAGVKDGLFGYAGRADRIDADRLREKSEYRVAREQVIIRKDLRDDEIDLSSGFIVLPAGIAPETSVQLTESTAPSTQALGSQGSEVTGATYETTPAGTLPTVSNTRVRFKVTLNRQQVYASFNAFANLADKAGTIDVIVDAQSLKGFDPVWLRNAVIEPLEEADIRPDQI